MNLENNKQLISRQYLLQTAYKTELSLNNVNKYKSALLNTTKKLFCGSQRAIKFQQWMYKYVCRLMSVCCMLAVQSAIGDISVWTEEYSWLTLPRRLSTRTAKRAESGHLQPQKNPTSHAHYQKKLICQNITLTDIVRINCVTGRIERMQARGCIFQ